MIGGWEFVQAAYAIAYGSLAAYGIGLVLQAKKIWNTPGPSPKDKS